MYEHYLENNDLFSEFLRDDDKEMKEAKVAVEKFIKFPYFGERMVNVFRKLAICHAAYEISTGFYCDDWYGIPKYVSYVLKSMISEEE